MFWNDQFYDDPAIKGCTKECLAPWGHSKGMLAWNEAGEGFVMQVTTPSWPASGNKDFPRKTGSAQNKRGGLFYVIDNAELHDSLENLLTGGKAPTEAPAK